MNSKDTVRSWRLFVHGSLSYSPVLKADVHVPLHLLFCLDDIHWEILDEDAFVRGLFELHSGLYIFAEEIVDFLVVDFDKTASNQVLLISLGIR